MKAVLGKNVQISLPKALQTSKVKTNILAMKGVPTDITNIEFKEFLDLNEISYTKAEHLKVKKTVGSSQSFDSKLTTLPSHKGCPTREATKPKCASCKGPHVPSYKGYPEYKKTGI